MASFHSAQLGELHAQAVPPDHWYLLILGVDPPRQGQGVGGSLIEPILRRADAEGRQFYLETMKPRNVTFYGKHGFDVVLEGDTADGGFTSGRHEEILANHTIVASCTSRAVPRTP